MSNETQPIGMLKKSKNQLQPKGHIVMDPDVASMTFGSLTGNSPKMVTS